MENKIAKHAVVSITGGVNVIKLYNDEPPSIHPLYDEAFYNVEIAFNNNGTVTLKGDRRRFDIAFHDIRPTEIDEEVCPYCIKKTRFRHKDIIRSGWFELLKTEPKEITFSNYKLII